VRRPSQYSQHFHCTHAASSRVLFYQSSNKKIIMRDWLVLYDSPHWKSLIRAYMYCGNSVSSL
jgi:hypothetical protein